MSRTGRHAWSGPGPVPRTAFKAVGGASIAPGRFDSFAAPSAPVVRPPAAPPPGVPLSGAPPPEAPPASPGIPLTLGTAGHVDHGKTALVGALTGVDTDRLAEEKARGLSIVLGYAPLRLSSGRLVSMVDVPGHERFVRTMVAGASGIDGYLMVVAADDGVMPQTREHAEVLRGLGVERGVVAITKADLADPGRARREALKLLPDSPVVVCSTHTGAGIERLAWALDLLAASLPGRPPEKHGARLHIDRVFTLRGHGTVVTGTLWSGEIAEGEQLQLLPGGLAARVRALQVHDTPVQRVRAGQRVALNLRGVRREQVRPGDVLASAGLVRERTVLDCHLQLREARHGERVQVHHGTRDVPGRLCELGEEGLWQLRLERPLLACDGDRLIVRRHAPPQTLGGGVILDASARRRGKKAADGRGAAQAEMAAAGTRPAGTRAAGARRAETQRVARAVGAREVPGAPRRAGARRAVHAAGGQREAPERLVGEVERHLREAHGLLSEAQLVKSFAPDFTGGQVAAALRALRGEGRVVRVSGRLYAPAVRIAGFERCVLEAIGREGALTLAQARDALGVGRKAAQALLEHLDGKRLTRRLDDDRRVLAR